MTKEEILQKTFGHAYGALNPMMHVAPILKAMEEYKQQPAAPLSSLPDWKEKFENWYNSEWRYDNLESRAIRGACRYAGDWIEQNVIAPLQAENTRLREQLQQAEKWLQHYETKL